MFSFLSQGTPIRLFSFYSSRRFWRFFFADERSLAASILSVMSSLPYQEAREEHTPVFLATDAPLFTLLLNGCPSSRAFSLISEFTFYVVFPGRLRCVTTNTSRFSYGAALSPPFWAVTSCRAPSTGVFSSALFFIPETLLPVPRFLLCAPPLCL